MMRTIERQKCVVCGSAGRELYAELEDQLFGIPGQWRMVKCSNRRCGTLWLDPAPLPADLGQAYATYYTHQAGTADEPWWRRDDIDTFAYWWLGYPRLTHLDSYGALRFTLLPKLRERALFSRLYLRYQANGRLLDVGCGAGEQMAMMRHVGWKVQGIDIDPAAAAMASAAGLDVHVGDLLSANFEPQSFDAVTLVHVIEHLPEPRAYLNRIRALLKPGGRLIVVTPNACSLGHRIYGRFWRGLEPPRHLALFTPRSLSAMCRSEMFDVVACRASARDAEPMLAASHALKSNGLRDAGRDVTPSPAQHFELQSKYERTLTGLRVPLGEELILVARA